MTGDRTFQTGGITYDATSFGFSNGRTRTFGTGVTVAYNSATKTYTLTAPGGATQTFGPADQQVIVAADGDPEPLNTTAYVKFVGTTREMFTLVVPGGAVPLSYTVIGTWSTSDQSSLGTVGPADPDTFRVAVGGSPTLASDMPKTGTANYAIGVDGTILANGNGYILLANSSGTFSANFGTGAITATLTLIGATPSCCSGSSINLGTFNGIGAIASAGPGYSGTLSGNGATGVFSGAFFGPQALETGFGYMLAGPNYSAAGVASGVKQ